MTFKSLADLETLLAEQGASIKGAANWIERVQDLRNIMSPTLPGQPRMFTDRQASILVLMSSLIAVGVRPKVCAGIAVELVGGETTIRPLYAVLIAKKLHRVIYDEISLLSVIGGLRSVAFGIVPVRLIISRVEASFHSHRPLSPPTGSVGLNP